MRIALSVIASLLAYPAGVQAHGEHGSRPLAIAPAGALASGAHEALGCDGEIQDTVFEYDLCLESRRAAIGDDSRAALGFWLIATLRAHGAASNGYPDAAPYLYRYRQTLAAYQAAQPRTLAELCGDLALSCPQAW